MTRILVTGANGFIGSHVVERLLRAGHEARALVRDASDLSFLRGMRVDLVRGDITVPGSLEAAVRGADVVVHAAGIAADWGPRERFFEVNLGGTRNIAEAARRAGARRIVHLSTTAIHGFAGGRHMDETAPLAETPFPYCQSKRAAEEWLQGFAGEPGPEVVTIRPGNVFGPRDHTFIEKYADALERRRAGYVGGGRCWTCPTYVENLAEAIEAACFEPHAARHAFIVTDGLEVTWREFTERLADALGAPRPTLSVPFWLGYGAASALEAAYGLAGSRVAPHLTRYRISNGGRDYHFSIEKARRILGWVPRVPLDESIRRTVLWYRNRHPAGS